MLSRKAKATFYALTGPIMALNGWIWRRFRAPGTDDGPLRVHLGPGQKNYLPGWVNIDANMFTGKCDIWADLRNPLPFRDGFVDAVYSHHVAEHLPDLDTHFRDVFRVLKRGGVYRVGGPNGDSAVRKFLEDDKTWFHDYPDRRESTGGRFVNFVFCRNEHLTMLSRSYLEELAGAAGFEQGEVVMQTRETGYPDLFAACLAIEHEQDFDCPRTLMMEFRKAL